MTAYLPLAMYCAVVLLMVAIVGGLGPFRDHVLFWIFVAYSSAYAARFALLGKFELPFSSLNLLSPSTFVRSTLLLSLLLGLTAVVYRVGYLLPWKNPDAVRGRAVAWNRFTSDWGLLIYRYLCLVALIAAGLGLLIRFAVQGERFMLGFAADVESRQASMGWGFASFILSQIIIAIVMVAIEFRRPAREVVGLFLLQAALALVSGSKGGFLMSLLYVTAFAFHRKRVRMTLPRVMGLTVVALASMTIGLGLRGWIESGSFSFTGLMSPAAVFGPLVARFFAFDITQIMIANPDTYSGIISEFRKYALSAVIPSALWPEKPLNPCLLLADGVGFPFVSCVAPGWIGGMLILFGQFGLVIAPIIVGFTMARLSRLAAVARETMSLRQPLLFATATIWLGIINEGVYYQIISSFLPLIVSLILVYTAILILNGRLGLFPVFAQSGFARSREH
jgi:hypothetical protein